MKSGVTKIWVNYDWDFGVTISHWIQLLSVALSLGWKIKSLFVKSTDGLQYHLEENTARPSLIVRIPKQPCREADNRPFSSFQSHSHVLRNVTSWRGLQSLMESERCQMRT